MEQKREGASFSNDIRKLILTLNILLLILFMWKNNNNNNNKFSFCISHGFPEPSAEKQFQTNAIAILFWYNDISFTTYYVQSYYITELYRPS